MSDELDDLLEARRLLDRYIMSRLEREITRHETPTDNRREPPPDDEPSDGK